MMRWRLIDEVACRAAVAGVGVALLVCTSSAQPAPGTFEGRPLEAVLRELQAQGLRIIFSSQVVTADLRVVSEPRAADARGRLTELLTPHGLVASPGPAGVILIFRNRPVDRERPGRDARASSPEPSRAAPSPPAAQVTHRERVTVTGAPEQGWGRDVGSSVTLGGSDLRSFRGGLTEDPLRSLQSLPHASASGDFHSDISVRASPARHVGVVIEGVATPWLRHRAPGRAEAGTLAMFGSEAVDKATLRSGVYPRQYGGHLGGQAELWLREGSREAPAFRAYVSGTEAGGSAEGPLGRTAQGSWLVSFRRSLVEWPVGRSDHEDTVFGFADGLARLVYDLGTAHQVTATVIAGRSTLERDDPNPVALGGGSNRATMINLAWRSFVGRGLVVEQRAALVAHDFQSVDQSRTPVGAGVNAQLLYRAGLFQALLGGVLETGATFERHRAFRRGLTDGPAALGTVAVDWGAGIDGTEWSSAAHAHYQWSNERLTLAPGLRVHAASVSARPVVDRWAQAEWRLTPAWSVHGSGGLVHQLPGLDMSLLAATRPDTPPVQLQPERALHVDAGIRYRSAGDLTWSATLFTRADRHLLRPRQRMPEGSGPTAADVGLFDNAMTGTARGIELSVERRSASGLDGWVGYTIGAARQTDRVRDETFWADLDQRHALNVAARQRLGGGVAIGATFRAGSSTPIPGYLAVRGGALVAGSQRNDIRLPAYARLDARAERAFQLNDRTITLFGEVLNVLDHANRGLASGFIAPTGEAVGFTQPLYPRMWSAGLSVRF